MPKMHTAFSALEISLTNLEDALRQSLQTPVAGGRSRRADAYLPNFISTTYLRRPVQFYHNRCTFWQDMAAVLKITTYTVYC